MRPLLSAGLLVLGGTPTGDVGKEVSSHGKRDRRGKEKARDPLPEILVCSQRTKEEHHIESWRGCDSLWKGLPED